MKLSLPKSLLARSVFLFWVILCLSLFILFTGTVSHIHQFIFEGLDSAKVGLARINGSKFILDLVAAFLGSVIFSLSCTMLGIFVLSLGGVRFRKSIDTLLSLLAYLGTAFLVGEIICSSVFLVIANAQKLTSGTVILAMFVMAGIGLYPTIRLFKENSLKQMSRPRLATTSRFERFLMLASISIVVLALFYSSARLSYDAVGMYFSDAKLIAMTDRIQYFSDFFVVSSLHVGMQYSAVIQVFGDQAARMYSWIGGLVILFFGLAIGEKLGLSRRALLILQAMILTSTVFVDLMGDGKIDLQTSAPMIAAIYWMIVDKRQKLGQSVYFLIGLLAGFSIISRLFNAFLVLLFVGFYYLWQMVSQRIDNKWDFGLLLRPALGIGAGVFILLGFHLLANQLIMGNALAPLEVLSRLNGSVWHYSYDPDDIWIYRLLYPFVVTYVNSPQSLGNITPLFVAFLPSLMLVRVRKSANFSKEMIGISIITLAVLALWVVLFYMIVEIRYVLFLWIILLMPVSVLIERTLDSKDKIFRGLLIFSITILLLFTMVRIVFISLSTYSPLDSEGHPQCYDSPLCDFIRPINEAASTGDRVLAINAYRYYMRPDLLACSSKADEYVLLQRASDESVDAFWEEVYRQGYQFVVYEENYSENHLYIHTVPDPAETPAWLTLVPISGKPGDERVVFRLMADNPPFQPDKTCDEVSPGVWMVESVLK